MFQLRQNAKLIQLAIDEIRSNIAFALLEKITDESFAVRRKKMHDVIKKAKEANWAGSTIRWKTLKRGTLPTSTNLIGQLTKDNIVD